MIAIGKKSTMVITNVISKKDWVIGDLWISLQWPSSLTDVASLPRPCSITDLIN